MKQSTHLFARCIILSMAITFFATPSFSQCNVNDKYDKIISGYHSSIALKDNGVYAVWGSDMKTAGNADQLAPQDINNTNYTGLTGTVLKAAMGGNKSGAAVDQAFILTTDGLWAWGVTGIVVNSSTVKSGSSFGRTSTTAANGFNSYGLPSALTPSDVASLFATYQTLVLLTTSGNVWMLTQTTLAVEGNGGTVTTPGTSKWVQVKKDASNYLTNVTAVRGQVSSSSYNAFIALTSTGEVYTWGNSVYLNNGSTATAKNFATQLTLPAEFNSSIPKMIGVTGGIGTTAATKNTYYILSNAGNLYALGDNSQRQCGDFSITERTTWVNVKKSSTAGDNLTNVNFFSCQEHNSSYPAVAAITLSGTLYTWGNNSSGMVGRTDNGLINGTLTTQSFDPGSPVNFTGKAVSVEMGGHTMVYLKEGSSQFCYVGHYTNGSMGDGTANTNGSSSATSLKHDCSSTPSISICGYVPVAPNATNSVISTSVSSIQADGTSVSIVTVQLKDGAGVNLTSSGGVVVIYTNIGTISAVTDNNNGTYTAILTSSLTPGQSTLTFTINGSAGGNTAQVDFVGSLLPLSWVNINAYRQNKTVRISWTTANEINVKSFDVERSTNGISWNIAIADIPAANLSGNNNYAQTDSSYSAEKIFYRVRQKDIDGRYTYSSVKMVSAIAEAGKISLYPVPATSSFHLANTSADNIKSVQLINVSGSLLRTWNVFKSSYEIEEIPSGMYIIRIQTADGSIQNLKLKKQ